jgi:catechol 2,3-dioxygenase
MRSLTVNDTGVALIDSEGRQRNPSERLDLEYVLGTLSDTDYSRPVPADTILGHVNLQVGDLDSALHFYRDGLGLLEHAVAPKLGVANFYAGAPSPHLVAVNVWQGTGASRKSPDAAGMRHFTIRFDSSSRLKEATKRLVDIEGRQDGYLVHDPAGIAILLTA